MDNVTHTLAGLLLAEAAWQARGPAARAAAAPGLRAVAAGAAAVAANLPDVDVLYGAAARLDKLASLLAHRGYTHTLLAAAAGVPLVWGGALALRGWRARGGTRRGAGNNVRQPAPPDAPADRRWLLGLVAAALLSHLALDWTNDYGVHPFSPFDDRWHYGDAVFIVEPWLWVAAVPVLLAAARRPAARVLLAFVLAAGLALAWAVPLVSAGAALALTLGAAAWLALALGGRVRARAGVAAWALAELAFFAGTRAARANVRAAALAAAPSAELADVVITPAPGNPLCARAIVVQTVGARGDSARRYAVATGWATALPAVVPAARCALRAAPAPALAMRAAAWPSSDAVRWERQWDAPLAELVALGKENCVAAAVLRFARVPVWTRLDSATVRLGDLRYDRGTGAGLAEFDVPLRPARCPEGVPPWVPPREGVIGGGGLP